MLNQLCQTISVSILVAIGATSTFCTGAAAKESNPKTSSFKLAQDPTIQQRLEKQREVEKQLKEDNKKQKDSDELNRLRDQNNRIHNNTPGFDSTTPSNNQNKPSGAESNSNTGGSSWPQISVSTGFKDGNISPGIGVRFKNNIGLEISGIFNQDSLPGPLNDFALPSDALLNDLGTKKVGAQLGGDVLGFLDVSPSVSVYGSLGLYFQNLSQVVQSQATNELYQQNASTNVSGAVGAGVTYSASDNIDLGVGYHSLRGVTARVGIKF
jgi:opacity protein-like surface antigen